ncbi:histidinol dehydrogenase [Pseudalkalibacillus hwajinpoensis]|uniref:histidinol dehydrogenase n=1 Tax=Guptibacillus hwajinpoensis TaxID=208199 RepID=UPI001CD7B4E4|nr:histidinol dehydrogenase [Pseudalkalibacillus hwajinpoensis]MCA0993470.1 histidinol dehydrogenase [Pseudalkalibacillus hwajinpoensis]
MKIFKGKSRNIENNNSGVGEIVTKELSGIKLHGEEAVRRLSKKFDNWNPESFRVSEEEIQKAIKTLPETFKDDTRYCQSQVRQFAEAQLETLRGFEKEMQPGVILGQKLIPISSVGAYVPGGRFPIVASVQMSMIPPKVAGVERVIACTPSQKGEGIHPGVLYAMDQAGVDEIYSLGGIQAIGTMAYGIEGIKPVDFIVGPGNAFVAEAKRQVFGQVGIDQIAGPSENLIIADEHADAELVAADIWGQCEHDFNAVTILITTSESFAKSVQEEMKKQIGSLGTREVAEASWEKNGEIILVEDKFEAVKVADDYAIEHVQVQAEDLDFYLENLRNYGSLFLGEETTVTYGDKGIGTNHILPTEKAARYTGGLWIGKFLKTVTYQRCTREASEKLAPIIARQCRYEGMEAHAVTAELREKKFQREKTPSHT